MYFAQKCDAICPKEVPVISKLPLLPADDLIDQASGERIAWGGGVQTTCLRSAEATCKARALSRSSRSKSNQKKSTHPEHLLIRSNSIDQTKYGTPAFPHRRSLRYCVFLQGVFIFAVPKYVVFSSLDKVIISRCHQTRRTRIPTQTTINGDLSRRSIRNVPIKYRKRHDRKLER